MKYTAEYDDGHLLQIESPSLLGAKKQASRRICRHPGSIIIRDAGGQVAAVSLYNPKKWWPFGNWKKWRPAGTGIRRDPAIPTLEELLAAVSERKMTDIEIQAFRKSRWVIWA